MTVDAAHARHLAEHDGTIYAFCSIGCRTRFVREPARLPRRAGHPFDGGVNEVQGTVEIKAPRDRVWAFLMDPTRSVRAAPVSRASRSIDETHFKAKAKVGIGFISARFNIDMEIAERDEPNRAVIKARGQAPGSAVDATATMALARRRRPAARRWTGTPTC